MSKGLSGSSIRLRGVRHNNLKNFDLDLPTNRLVVVTGLSGSGKSSLAFDTLYAEGQRRYIETFSPYARQFFERMDKPQVDSIAGIPPAIAIEQRNSVKSTRSTVGTMTEICDYMKVVWAHVSELRCRGCGKRVERDTPQRVWTLLHTPELDTHRPAEEVIVTFEIALSDKLSLEESIGLIGKQGYQRLYFLPAQLGVAPEIVRLEDARTRLAAGPARQITVVQDRLKLGAGNRARFIEACEQAYHFGKGKLTIHFLGEAAGRKFSNRFHCAECDLDYREPVPALFSFNHPLGACPTCRGFGRTITLDYSLAVPDRSLTLAGGVVRPWQTGQSAECQADLMKFCRIRQVPTDVPFDQLSEEWQRWVLDGDPHYGQDPDHEWPRAWYGIKGYFRSLEARTYKMHVRVLLSRYRSYRTCDDCGGRRFQPEALLFRTPAQDGRLLSLAEFYQMPVREALLFMEGLAQLRSGGLAVDALKLVFGEVTARLRYLDEVGLGYLTLDRPTRSLSGGETERVNLTTCLGTRLVNTLFVLDEPSVGLHARDTRRLIGILQRLRDMGNTVVVVEHDQSVMRAADQILDLGPGHGESGGRVMFQGSYAEILKAKDSLTGQYLRGEKRVEIPARRPVRNPGSPASPGQGIVPFLTVHHARRHNLKDLTVEIPLGRLVCVTGVSGSGKTTLLREVVLPLLEAKLKSSPPNRPEKPVSEDEDEGEEEQGESAPAAASAERIEGWEKVGRVVLVDQSLLGKTPRSNPAVYIGSFDDIRELFAQSEAARQQGLNASAFSFNSRQGQCELCRGAGFEKIEMQFLSDVFIRCPACKGRRYREHILTVKLPGPAGTYPQSKNRLAHRYRLPKHPGGRLGRRKQWSIADLLDGTVDEAVQFLSSFAGSHPAKRAISRLRLLQEVGLGYLRLGQPINTLSGGESQRLKLVSHLAEFASIAESEQKSILFLLDEPTTGLHMEDVRILLQLFQRLVDEGHSVVVIEHNLDLIKCADWVIDIGPDAGEQGGRVVVAGTPEDVAAFPASYTGENLREIGVGRSAASSRR